MHSTSFASRAFAGARFSHRSLIASACISLLSTYAAAQAPPDAGALRRQIEQQRQQQLPKEAAPQFLSPAPLESIGGATVTVNTFRFDGNTLLSTAALRHAVAKYVGRPLDFAGLQNAAIAAANAYREAGWVVRAYLPQQDVSSGVVTIQVIEARMGAVHIEGAATRISTKRVQHIVEAAQRKGVPVSADALDRGLLLVNDLPGVAATGRLAPGTRQSETDLAVSVLDGPLVSGSLAADDVGSRFTGEERIVGSASLNDRLGIGDRAEALLLHSRGSDYVSLGYSLPLGARGLRVGANASHLSYDIVTREFDALDAHGTSDAFGVETSYPVIRARAHNLYVALNAERNRYDNQSAGVTTTSYSVQSASAGVYGNVFDEFLGGGSTTASLYLSGGRVDLSGSPNEAADALTTRTAGSFEKARYSLSRLQTLTDRVSLFAGVRGQLASKNLDSSEKLYLGGSQGVRAYPQDEAGGAEGALFDLEVRTRVFEGFSVTGFGDVGYVKVNHDNDIVGAVAHNNVTLKGFGVACNWASPFGVDFSATFAHRIGDNPNPTPSGKDQDGTLVKNRLWLQATMPF